MGVKKQLSKYGDSHMILIDRVIMEFLGWQRGSLLDLTTDGVSLIIRLDGVDAAGGKVGLRSRATMKRKTKELVEIPSNRKKLKNAE